MTGPKLILDRAMGVKSGRVSEFTAMAVENYARKYLDVHIEEINSIQRTKRDAMLAALGENFGTSAKWSNPDGGLYIWVKLKEGSDILALHQRSVSEIDVGFHPGTNYSPSGETGQDHIRLCYGYNEPEDISEGISRLADFLHREGVLDS